MEKIIIAALSENNIIGNNNSIPWKCKEDLKHFRRLTLNYPIIMGRKTYESIGRILDKRLNIIITRQKDYFVDNALVFNSLDQAINYCEEKNYKKCYIIGGGEIYKQSIDIVDKLEITRIHKIVDGDTKFPEINLKEWKLINEEHYDGYSFLTYVRVPVV